MVAARDPHFYPEHGIAHFRPESLLLFEADEPNHLEPSDTAWWEAKTAALEAHVSQLETTHLYGIERTEHTAIAEALEKFRARELENLRAAAQPFGKQAGEAVAVLEFAPQAASETVLKVVQSAIANARTKADRASEPFDERELVVQAAYVDEGPTMKRFRPRAQGRAYRINKRTSHITVVVGQPKGRTR